MGVSGSPVCAVLLLAALAARVASAPAASEVKMPVEEPVEVPVECVPTREDPDVVLCRAVPVPAALEALESERVEGRARGPRRLLGRIGFLTGLHLGGAISSSGSLSASHSLNVFGKVMNTALSVSYGPNGYYQAPGGFGGGARPPLNPVNPGFGGFADDPNAAGAAPAPSSPSTSASAVATASSPNPDKGGEVSAVMAGTISRDATRPGIARLEADKDDGVTPQNRLPVAEDIQPAQPSQPQDAEPAPIHEEVDEDSSEDMVGEEPLPSPAPAPPPPASTSGLQLSSQHRAQLEAVARVRTHVGADEQHRLFLQHHNKHVAAFNHNFAQYNGDVSRVAVLSRART